MMRAGMLSRLTPRITRFSRGLRGKFILLISALLITTSMALGWIFLVREVRDEGTKMSAEAKFLAGHLASLVELGLSLEGVRTALNVERAY